MVFQKPCLWNLWSYTTWKAREALSHDRPVRYIHSSTTLRVPSSRPLLPVTGLELVLMVWLHAKWTSLNVSSSVLNAGTVSQVIFVLEAQRKPRMYCSTGLYWSWCFIFGKRNQSNRVAMLHGRCDTPILSSLFPQSRLCPLGGFLLLRSLHSIWQVFMVHQSTSWNSHAQGVTSFEAALFQLNFESQMHCKMQQMV